MSEFNSILSDKELRELLQQYMLESDQDDVLTEQLIEMESKIAFGAVPAAALLVPNETEMIGKLTKSFAGKTGLYAWAIGLGVSLVLGVGIYVYVHSRAEKSVPAIQNETPAEKNIVPDVPPAHMPETPNRYTAYAVTPTDTAETSAQLGVMRDTMPEEKPFEKAQLSQGQQLFNFNPGPVRWKVKKDSMAFNTSIDTVFTGVKRIEVDAGICDLSVARVNSDKVTVKGGILVETKGITSKPEFAIKHERKGELLKIWVEQKKECNVIIGSLNIDASLNIEVPAGTDVDLYTANGNINLSELDGRLCKAKSGYGNISASKINTGFVLTAQSGNITVADCAGGADLNSLYGNVAVANHKGNMDIKASSGDITVNGLTADKFEVKSSYGNIRLSNLVSPVVLRSASGDIHLENVQGDVRAESSYGNQHLKKVTGNVTSVSASGDVKVDELNGDLNVKSSYGNIVANNFTGNMVAMSQSGEIKGKNVKVSNALDLNATYGNIRLQLVNPLDELSFDLAAAYGEVCVKKDGANIKGEDGKLQLEKGRIRIKGNTTSGDQVYE